MFTKSRNMLIFLHLYGFKCIVHVLVIIIILKEFNLMILTTFNCEKNQNQNNINISNKKLLSLTP
jgi:hypothetical protein